MVSFMTSTRTNRSCENTPGGLRDGIFERQLRLTTYWNIVNLKVSR